MGVTENVWGSLSEDKRQSWKHLTRIIGIVGALLVVKTGNIYFDGALALLTGVFLVIVIETQRTFSKISPRYRKRRIRVAVAIGKWGAAVLGIAIFSQAVLGATATVLSEEILPAVTQSRHQLTQVIILAATLVAVPLASYRVYRDLNIRKIVYEAPRDGLKQILVHRQPQATSFEVFALLELSALLVCLIFASSVAEIANMFIAIFRVM
jgi:hypothetical protein